MMRITFGSPEPPARIPRARSSWRTGFAGRLSRHLQHLIERDCEPVRIDTRKPRLWRQLLSALAFHVARRFPRWAGWVPGRRISTAQPALPDAG